jgi:ribonucleoside-diphosphate reductase alpha chain
MTTQKEYYPQLAEKYEEDFYWLNEDSREFLRNGYLLDGVTAEERVREIAERAEEILGEEGFADKFYDYMSRGFYSLASPVWSNFGLDRGLPISCFGSHIEDNIESILYTQAEVGQMTKLGGGTSGYFGELRPRGAPITNNGKSNGSYSFTELFDTIINVISQGETRRGQFAGYIDVEHEDLDEWLEIKTEGNPVQDIYYGVIVGDEWFQDMLDGDEEKREKWADIIETRINIGVPYIIFRGNMNGGKPQVYKDKDYEINASNLCLTGDQRVVTDKGYKKAEDLYESGEELTLFDGEKAIDSSRMKLREKDADVYKFTLDNGIEQKVTSYHGMPVYDGRGEYTRTKAKNVNEGDRIVVQKNKGLFGNAHRPEEAFLLGMWQSDGTSDKKGNKYIDIWENDFDLTDEINNAVKNIYEENDFTSYELSNQYGKTGESRELEPPELREVDSGHSNDRKKRLLSSKLEQLGFEKGKVPEWIYESDEETVWEYIRGLLIADGTAYVSESNGNPIQIAYADINKDFLKELQLLFNNLGLSSQIRVLRDGGKRELPDGNGGTKEYDTQDCYRLIVGNKNSALEIEENTGFLSRKDVDIEEREYRDNTKNAYEVVDIEYVGSEDVYCPTTKTDESVFISQGALTFNCTEIALPASDDESFVCCLSSMNALHYDEWKDTDAVETLTYFLDAVMEEFIEEAKGTQFMERAVRFAERHRAVGIGVLGWHSYLQSKMIPWNSAEAMQENNEIFNFIKERSYEASEELADKFGEPEVLEGYGRRNTTTMAVAPTKSSSVILGQVSPSVEPLKSNYFVRDGAKLKTTQKNRFLEELLQQKGKDERETWDSIMENDGSVQHLDCLDEQEKEVFRTFAEIPQMSIIKQAAQRQKYIDQAQSINISVDPSEVSIKEMNQLYIEAWKNGVKSLYYQKSVNAAQKFSQEILECEACEG